uniref:Uncharacterized protein n=1 Tax=Aureoumbra lagunensis TaxID=44058 RepID=A0A7S3JUE6_9STRA
MQVQDYFCEVEGDWYSSEGSEESKVRVVIRVKNNKIFLTVLRSSEDNVEPWHWVGEKVNWIKTTQNLWRNENDNDSIKIQELAEKLTLDYSNNYSIQIEEHCGRMLYFMLRLERGIKIKLCKFQLTKSLSSATVPEILFDAGKRCIALEKECRDQKEIIENLKNKIKKNEETIQFLEKCRDIHDNEFTQILKEQAENNQKAIAELKRESRHQLSSDDDDINMVGRKQHSVFKFSSSHIVDEKDASFLEIPSIEGVVNDAVNPCPIANRDKSKRPKIHRNTITASEFPSISSLGAVQRSSSQIGRDINTEQKGVDAQNEEKGFIPAPSVPETTPMQTENNEFDDKAADSDGIDWIL